MTTCPTGNGTPTLHPCQAGTPFSVQTAPRGRDTVGGPDLVAAEPIVQGKRPIVGLTTGANRSGLIGAGGGGGCGQGRSPGRPTRTAAFHADRVIVLTFPLLGNHRGRYSMVPTASFFS